MKFILASNSPRRRELLKQVVKEYDVVPACGEEDKNQNLTPERLVQSLAKAKAEEVFLKNSECMVLGCDTIVVFQGKVLGKPKDEQDAYQTLKALSGNTHEVLTGVCLKYPLGEVCACERSEVVFENLTDEQIWAYIKTGSPMDKAGSYGIQDGGIVKEYHGSYSNIVGLPIELLNKIIQEVGYDPNRG